MALAGPVLGGCGGGSHAATTQPVAAVGAPPPNVVGERQIGAYPVGSPARSLLELWQAIEFSDIEGARQLVTGSALAGQSPASFARMVQTIGDNVPGLRILNTSRVGPDASVRAYLVFYSANGRVAADSPMAFQLRRSEGRYRLSDLTYFTRREQEIRRALHHAVRR